MLTPSWLPLVRYPGFQPTVLLTFVFDRDDLMRYDHPALAPRALRCGTRAAHVAFGSTRIPFWPTVVEWPELRREWSPTERRAPVASTHVRLNALAQFPHDIIRPGTPPAVHYRLDLWAPGIPGNELLPLMAGPVTEGAYERITGGITLTLEDGDTQRSVDFPPGNATISSDDFPDAPDLVLGSAKRQVIFGPFPDPIPCIQISKDGKRWYLCEPACTLNPNSVQIGGIEVGGLDHPIIRTNTLASDPTRTYTEIVFPEGAAQTALQGMVTASGGIGLSVNSAPLTLLRDIGGYRISARAERDLQRIARQFDFSIFLNSSGPVYSVVRDRILPQTDVAMTMHLDEIDTFQLLGQTSDGKVAMGEGLWNRVQEQKAVSTSATVWNVIEVAYRRQWPFPRVEDTLTRAVFTIDATYGGPIGALLQESQRLYGRRELGLTAADLVSVDGIGLPLGVQHLAEVTAQLTARPVRSWTYDATWWLGLGLDLNDRRLLTDAVEDLDEEATRVTAIAIRPVGPRITFSAENAA